MLIDPENPSDEWQNEVRAPNLQAAILKCEAVIADVPLVELINVSQVTQTPNKKGDYKFVCWYSSEVRPDDNLYN